MSNLIEYAKREFKILGYIPLDQEQKNGLNKRIQENILELLEVFSKQGHSGMSASYCISMFEKLALFKPLTPLTGEDDEWEEIGDGEHQNKRDSAVFKEEHKGAYYIYAIVWQAEQGGIFTGFIELEDGALIDGHQPVTFPFTPKTFHIDIIELESGRYKLKDPDQLKEALEYYGEVYDGQKK